MTDDFALPLQGRRERQHLYEWVTLEEEYVAGKFDDERDGHDAALARYDFHDFWYRQIVQYLDRATVFLHGASNATDDTKRRHLEMRAQQALAKAMMTAKGCVESSIRVYGPLPTPGVPSGEVSVWGTEAAQ